VGALRWWASGLIFYASTMFLLRTFYSLKDTRTPMIVNLGLTVVQVGLYVVLSTGIGSWSGLGINGLPIADVVFFTLSSIALAMLLRRRIGGYDLRGVGSVFGRMLLASIIAAGVAWAMTLVLAPLVSGIGGSLVQVAVGGVVGLLIAVGLGKLFGVREVSVAIDGLKRVASRRRNRLGE
jgi:putative peptidoglycan lipid II flippase